MIIMYGNGKTEFGPGIDIKLTGDELADAIMKYVGLHDVEINGPRTVRVNGELCEEASIYVDPSGDVISGDNKLSGRGE